MEVDVFSCITDGGDSWMLVISAERWPETPPHIRHVEWVPVRHCTLNDITGRSQPAAAMRKDVEEIGYAVFRIDEDNT